MPSPPRWFSRNRAQLRLGVRITVAALLAYAVCQMLNLAQSYAAVLTAVIVTQASVGASLKAMLDRFLGSLGGAAWAVAVLLALHTSSSPGLTFVVAVTPLAFLAALQPVYRIAPVTAIILLLIPSYAAGPLTSATQRIVEIAIGSVIALMVALSVLPARAQNTFAIAAGRAVSMMGELAAMILKGPPDAAGAARIQDLHDQIRMALGQAETAAEEAMHERATYLSGAPDPQPLCRALRRVRADLVMIGRATAEPLPITVQTYLERSTAGASAEVANFLNASGDSLTTGKPTPPLAPVGVALTRHASAVAELRRAGLLRELPDEAIGRIFGLTFAMEQLHLNLADLSDRMGELAR